jgi:acyloxyacyl hydrolase
MTNFFVCCVLLVAASLLAMARAEEVSMDMEERAYTAMLFGLDSDEQQEKVDHHHQKADEQSQQKGKGLLSRMAIGGQNGGLDCLLCTMFAQVFVVKIESENTTINEALTQFCSYLPSVASRYCEHFVAENGAKIVDAFFRFETPDRICQQLSTCNGQCSLFPGKSSSSSSSFARSDKEHMVEAAGWIDWIVKRFGDEHKPLDDVDNDFFSPVWRSLRGRSWRGRDCNDLDHRAHPGALPIDEDRQFDSNCNGISGVDLASGDAYEKTLCSVDQMGVAILGDSVGAHFAFPTTFYFPAPGVYDHFFFFLANEADFPAQSWITGYENDTTGLLDPQMPHPLSSVYLAMRARNLCVHRDFQNLAVNGADSALFNGNVQALQRQVNTDRPMLFFVAAIGDDICDHKDASGWTTPEEFRENTLRTYRFLQQHLPKGSLVVNIGVIDGRAIYDTMHAQLYPRSPQPLGDATYADFWDFMNCLHTSPCMGWLNTNATMRDAASARARQYNAQYADIMSNQTLLAEFSNFELAYYDFPIGEMLVRATKLGYEPIQLFEPFLSMHTTQVAVSLLADILVERLGKDFGERALGAINPNNLRIEQLFGRNLNGY